MTRPHVPRVTWLSALVVCLACSALAAFAATARADLHVSWMRGVASPGTPARYDKVGVIKVGSPRARNVLVLEPGTSAGAAYFVPLAQWLVSRAPHWQVWSVERRENLLEDQSILNLAKQGLATSTQLFDYYLGWLDPALQVQSHIQLIPNSSVSFAKRWGMSVAVGDLRHVIEAARRLGGKVVLGGHSLGGAVVTAYATWDFHGVAGARDLAGLVYIDGGSLPAVSAATARSELSGLDSPGTSPWLTFGGIPAPFAGLFSATGATAALIDPDSASLGQSSGLLSAFHLTPSVPVTNLAQFGYALNVGTSPIGLLAAQAHLGRGISTRRPTARLGRRRRAHPHHPVRTDVLGARGRRRGRDGVVLPRPAHAGQRRRRQRSFEPGSARARRRRNAWAATAQAPGDLRVRRAPRRRRRAARRARPRRTIGDPRRQPPPDQPREHLRAQRPRRRVPENVFFAGLMRFLARIG